MDKYIQKWYNKLSFPPEFDAEFEAALKTISTELCEIPVSDYSTTDAPELRLKNLMMYLCFCEELEGKYKEKNIPEQILLDTLSDIVIWSKTNYELTGHLGLCQTGWLRRHLSGELFRLGRLQFAFGKSEESIDAIGVKKGDAVIEVHIPEGGALSCEECEKSFDLAKAFFAEFFPEYDYKCFTCHSWLLDDTLNNFLGKDSNILKFQSLFTKIHSEESDAILRYTFAWNANKDNIEEFEPKSGFAKKIKEYFVSGGKFYTSLGYIPKNRL